MMQSHNQPNQQCHHVIVCVCLCVSVYVLVCVCVCRWYLTPSRRVEPLTERRASLQAPAVMRRPHSAEPSLVTRPSLHWWLPCLVHAYIHSVIFLFFIESEKTKLNINIHCSFWLALIRPVDVMRAMVTVVWMLRRKIITAVLCCVVNDILQAVFTVVFVRLALGFVICIFV